MNADRHTMTVAGAHHQVGAAEDGMQSGSSGCLRLVMIVVVAVGALLGAPRPVRGAPADDAWVAGYATAVLERELDVHASSLRVLDGVVTLEAQDVAIAARPGVIAALRRIRGVRRVEIVMAPSTRPDAPPAAVATVRAPIAVPAHAQSSAPAASAPAADTSSAGRAPEGSALAAETPDLGFLPGGHLFQPLIADPRWPRLTAAYRISLRKDTWPTTFAPSVGETMTFYRDVIGSNGRFGHWEAGVQAAAFPVFDLDTDSLELINTDFIVSIFAAYRYGAFSMFTRLFHQSSHLGDELVLRPDAPERINLSFEALDVKLSYDLPLGLRAYGGGGYLTRVDPVGLGRGFLQAGSEWRSPQTVDVWRARLRPVAGFDLKFREMTDWHADVSLRAGLQLDSTTLAQRNLQLLVEYYNGRSLDGQLFQLPIEYVGLGLHFNF